MKNITVIGGGIIGLCTAEKLLSQGHKVTLIEREKIAAGASYGNAAGVAYSEVMPMASFSTIRKSLKWFLDPSSPFKILPQDLPWTLSWLFRFTLAARKSQFDRSLRVQAELMRLARSTWPDTLNRSGLSHLFRTTGALYLYDTRAQYESAAPEWALRRQYGVEYERYEGPELHRFQPGFAPHVYAGIHVPEFQLVTDPNVLCLALHEYLSQQGLETVYDQVNAIKPQADGVEVMLDNSPARQAGKVVIAAGPWSGRLSASMGDKVPVIGERGYNTTLPMTALPELPRIVFFAPHGFVISPLQDGIRVGGGSEIARLDRAPDYTRSKALLDRAKSLIPDLDISGGKQWMGMRPTTPDTLPVIGTARRSHDIVYAFGHGHLGLTQATATAQLVSEIIDNKPGAMDLSFLSVARF